ncbi:non-canonical purine NTP pyrophosphatase, RdgB/HAM1 family [Marispirochaeta aestuarii]|uniref:dITP/XTP pyrophosphatase n=1 Tax=Marispirochaeta aestuarii TaxID=1963862 RepID=A0A1Y1S097_9SPIO|nr:RdgB/HAM1 family non-canonical purine NTP pyrophosphatase [Marispirochaeta aestuarii]ORC36547.1 non-canonical purine NTP pyrophosphatase, RdgB/HAM1 family [Marispirochaeta aestuarii]
MELLLATGNRHKRDEFQAILPEHRIVIPEDLGTSFECEETGASFCENSLIKAAFLHARAEGRPVIADDSGLCVEALDGAPGIRSARYGEDEGTSLSSQEKYELLLRNLQGKTNRNAAFVCSLVFYIDDLRYFIFQETCRGIIAEAPRGSGGFGYDPVFFIPETGRTMAELSEEEKNRISHRGKAGSALRKFLQSYGDDLGVV